jgi:site-specific recombinase XerD
MTRMAFPTLLQRFFTDRLLTQMEASRHTIASYRDTFRLLIRFASARCGKPPTKLGIEDLDADMIGDFLVHVETARANTARSRNTRLAAIRSFFRYVAMSDPAWLLHCQCVLAMPNKRYIKRSVTFLDAQEITALLAAPNRSTWAGRRDQILLLVTLETGLRASELIGLRCGDAVFGTGAHIRCLGKGRKERCTPLRRETAKALQLWIKERRGDPDQPLFPSIRGNRLSRDALERLVGKHCLAASRSCPSFTSKRVSPHTLRHSAAMQLLRHGVDQSVIALWLGHESVETTQMYVHADMRLKEQALARVAAPDTHPGRFRPDDQLLAWLEAL